ncbi:MAG: hypothetical protein AAB909_01415 [Patescibacteria group bacterium]
MTIREWEHIFPHDIGAPHPVITEIPDLGRIFDHDIGASVPTSLTHEPQAVAQPAKPVRKSEPDLKTQ